MRKVTPGGDREQIVQTMIIAFADQMNVEFRKDNNLVCCMGFLSTFSFAKAPSVISLCYDFQSIKF